MKKEIVIISCDICAQEDTDSPVEEKQIPIIFTTEQTEGRSVKPHLIIQKMDICEECMEIIVRGYIPFGHGAQGHNKYGFRRM